MVTTQAQAKKPRRHRRPGGRRAARSVVLQAPPDESPTEAKRDNYAVDVAPDRIDMDAKRLDRENPVCSLPPETEDDAPAKP